MPDLSRARLIVVTAAVMMSILLVALDQTIVGTAMPRIVAELRGLDYYAWVVTAYMIASTTMVPISGKLGDLFGRKPFLLVGMIGFVVASALCGMAQDMAQLIAFRGLQGLFGGVLFATIFSVLADLYPPRTRARIMGIFAGMWGLASVVGPTTGGYITDFLGWRWVFYVNLPLGLATIAIVALAMPYVRSAASWRDIDFAGAATLAGGLVPLLTALSITRDHSWTSPEVVGLFGVAGVLLAAFFLIERRAAHPIVPFSLFRNVTFSVAVVTGFLVAFGMFGAIVFVPIVYQGVLGVSATASGQLLTPMMLGLVFASVATGQLMTRLPRYKYIGTAGIALMAIGLLLLSGVTAASSELEVVRDIVIVGVGLGATLPLYLNAVQSALPREVVGVATSQVQFWRNVGGTVGTALLGSILSSRLPGAIRGEVARLDLPTQAAAVVPQGGGSVETLFDPQRLEAARAAIPAQLAPLFDRALEAVRVALAVTLHDIFLYAAGIVALAMIASLFLVDVPLRGRMPTTEGERGTAPAFGD
jgi:EmrB/QacA subfamily drug resistance transporter